MKVKTFVDIVHIVPDVGGLLLHQLLQLLSVRERRHKRTKREIKMIIQLVVECLQKLVFGVVIGCFENGSHKSFHALL